MRKLRPIHTRCRTKETRTTMTIRILVFLSALSFFLLGSGSGLAAPQQDVGPAARKLSSLFGTDFERTT